jgi:hypothetical protein
LAGDLVVVGGESSRVMVPACGVPYDFRKSLSGSSTCGVVCTTKIGGMPGGIEVPSVHGCVSVRGKVFRVCVILIVGVGAPTIDVRYATACGGSQKGLAKFDAGCVYAGLRFDERVLGGYTG